jgi:hypothetical protein
MSTPSDTMRTATIQRLSAAANFAIRSLAAFSSESTTVGFSPVIDCRIVAYERAA